MDAIGSASLFRERMKVLQNDDFAKEAKVLKHPRTVLFNSLLKLDKINFREGK